MSSVTATAELFAAVEAALGEDNEVTRGLSHWWNASCNAGTLADYIAAMLMHLQPVLDLDNIAKFLTSSAFCCAFAEGNAHLSWVENGGENIVLLCECLAHSLSRSTFTSRSGRLRRVKSLPVGAGPFADLGLGIDFGGGEGGGGDGGARPPPRTDRPGVRAPRACVPHVIGSTDAIFTGLAECSSAVETERLLDDEALRLASGARTNRCSEARLGIEYDVSMARGGAASTTVRSAVMTSRALERCPGTLQRIIFAGSGCDLHALATVRALVANGVDVPDGASVTAVDRRAVSRTLSFTWRAADGSTRNGTLEMIGALFTPYAPQSIGDAQLRDSVVLAQSMAYGERAQVMTAIGEWALRHGARCFVAMQERDMQRCHRPMSQMETVMAHFDDAARAESYCATFLQEGDDEEGAEAGGACAGDDADEAGGASCAGAGDEALDADGADDAGAVRASAIQAVVVTRTAHAK